MSILKIPWLELDCLYKYLLFVFNLSSGALDIIIIDIHVIGQYCLWIEVLSLA